MSAITATFADLLAPIEPKSFLEQSWEKEPLHIERPAGAYKSLLTNNDVEAVIASGGLRYPAIQLAKGGGFYPPEAFTRSLRSGGDVFTGIPVLDRIRDEYQAGATISLPGFHRAWKPLGLLAVAIEEEFDHPVHTNVYITPGNAAGFSPHYDTHEVFVLQIAGRKHWRIEQPPLHLPHRSQPFNPQTYVKSGPVLEVDLSPGDLLYLPRGFVHSTATSDSFSVHVTLGITVYTWVELLAAWAELSRHVPSLRRALPPGFAARDDLRQSLGDRLRRVITELQQVTDHDTLLDSFAQRIRFARPQAQQRFSVDTQVFDESKNRRDRP
jgi:ribosomal protein L16 Arg81 hydroxylase